MSQAIITRRGRGAKMPPAPQYTGTMNAIYTSTAMTGGYAEFTTSGTLTWEGEMPETVDIFCVGGGGGGAGGYITGTYYGGAGGGSGYTKTVTNAQLEESTAITIGAGGAGGPRETNGYNGSPTSVGNLCTANGGLGGNTLFSSSGSNGGSGGGGGGSNTKNGGNGGSNGSGGGTGNSSVPAGAGQGTTTADLIGRVHAGGGGGSGGNVSGQGGTSEFTAGSGGSSGGGGGGGYGGGGGGGSSVGAGAAGGQGFAMIAWGTNKEDLGLT